MCMPRILFSSLVFLVLAPMALDAQAGSADEEKAADQGLPLAPGRSLQTTLSV